MASDNFETVTANGQKIKSYTSGDFSFVSIAPCKTSDDANRRLWALQSIERTRSRGIDISKTQFPGSGLFIKTARWSDVSPCNRGDYLSIQPIKESQLLELRPQTGYGPKGGLLHTAQLLYKVYKSDNKLIRSILEANGFYSTEGHSWNLMWLGAAGKNFLYSGLKEWQKINHFPSGNEITKKDRLATNIKALQEQHGEELINIIPETYILPEEAPQFQTAFENQKGWWIVKPTIGSQGRGIYLVDKISEVPRDESIVVQKYIANPFLIDNRKFDLRIYVCVTCYDPLRIYIYDEGLARFASENYNTKTTGFSKYMHLTNYSINKGHENFQVSDDPQNCENSHKWSFKSLNAHFESIGLDSSLVWNKIYDLVIKTIISIESTVVESVTKLGLSSSNCFELYGFDVLIDSDLHPWLMEVNLSPSMNTDSPLDMSIKSNLIADTFTLVGIRSFDRRKERAQALTTRSKRKRVVGRYSRGQTPTFKTEREKSKEDLFIDDIFSQVNSEFDRRRHFVRIYPAQGTDIYNPLFQVERKNNSMVYSRLFPPIEPNSAASTTPSTDSSPLKEKEMPDDPKTSVSVLPVKKNLKLPHPNLVIRSFTQSREQQTKLIGKISLTGDDILMEYLLRIIDSLKQIKETSYQISWKHQLNKFISHYIWQRCEPEDASLLSKLESKLEEMREKRMKLMRQVFKSRRLLDKAQQRRSDIKDIYVQKFSIKELEKMLRGSNINISKELVSYFFNSEGIGLLSEIYSYQIRSSLAPDEMDLSLQTRTQPENIRHITLATLARFKKRKLRMAFC